MTYLEIVRETDNTRAVERAFAAGGLTMIARAGGLHINMLAQAKAPYLTGTLRNSIHVEDEPTASPTRASVLVGTNLEYAPRQEFGFVGMDSLGRVFNDPGRPYMRPAWDEGQPEAIRIMQNAARTLIQVATR